MRRFDRFEAKLGLALLLAIALPSAVALSQGPASSAPIACKRDLWIIDTHAVGDDECDAQCARYLRLGDDCQWVEESEASFLQTMHPDHVTNFMLPGYGTKMKWIVQHLWSMHQHLTQQAKCRGVDCPPTRLVILAWPSEVERVPVLRDAREKAVRSDLEGYWLAQLLAKMPKETRVNLIGYSFGSRIATSAAHHLAGGQRCDCPTIEVSDSPSLTATLVASAIDADWLADCQPHSLALDRFDRLLLINNCADPVLRAVYRVLTRPSRAEALGAVGLLLPEAHLAEHVRQWEVSHIVGRTHDWRRYVESPEIMSAIAEDALGVKKP